MTMTPTRIFLVTLAAAALTLGAPALADDPAHGAAHTEAAHAEPAHDAEAPHGTEAAHGAADHGDQQGHGDSHHYDYAGDDDHDGKPNWRDPMTGTTANEHYVATDLGWHLFNLAILLGVLVYFLRRPVGDALKNRAHDTRSNLTEAARLRDEAKKRNEEIGARLATFEQEVESMRAEAKKAAAAEEAALIARAREEAKRILEASQRNINDEVVKAQVALRKDAVTLAVKLAEQTLKNKVQSDDQRRLARQFLDTINADGA